VTAPARIIVSQRSARVSVSAEPDAPLVVDGGTYETTGDGAIVVKARSSAISIRCAEGTDLVVGTRSGRVETRGRLGAVQVSTSSGSVTIDAAREVDVRTASGRIDIGRADGPVRCVCGSGRVTIESAGSVDVSVASGRVEARDTGDARVHTTSGRIKVAARRGSAVEVRAISGRVDVSLPEGSAPATRLSARGGRIRNSVPSGDEGSLDVQTVSGSVTVSWR